MSGLLFLTTDDFHTIKGTKGNIMCNNIQGFSLILFYSTQCQHCQSLIPVFKQLPGTVGGCQFGMINVSQNKDCVLMSRETVAPIKVVPYVILYVNGKPYMRYQGPHDKREIARFIVEVSQKVQGEWNNGQHNKQQVNTQQVNRQLKKASNEGIPAYTIGQPLCGPDGICYLEFNGAYGSNKSGGVNPNSLNKVQIPEGAGMY